MTRNPSEYTLYIRRKSFIIFLPIVFETYGGKMVFQFFKNKP